MKTFNEFLVEQEHLAYYVELMKFIDDEYRNKVIYPPRELIFNAFNYVDFKDIRVVIIGQDPYHGFNQADGLAFSVNEGVAFPPSLRNIFKEMVDDVGGLMPESGDLTYLAKQGVLLLNNVLTVPEGFANGHQGEGWEEFVQNVVLELNHSKEKIVYILWGANARRKKEIISEHHYIIEGVHPSPLSSYRGFFGSKPFSKANDYLIQEGKEPIEWNEKN